MIRGTATSGLNGVLTVTDRRCAGFRRGGFPTIGRVNGYGVTGDETSDDRPILRDGLPGLPTVTRGIPDPNPLSRRVIRFTATGGARRRRGAGLPTIALHVGCGSGGVRGRTVRLIDERDRVLARIGGRLVRTWGGV